MPTFFKSSSKIAIVLFLIGQGLAAAHAVEHGIEPHEHNGVTCSAPVYDERENLLAPKRPVAAGSIKLKLGLLTLPNVDLFTRNLALRPPATGPPAV